MNLISVPTAIIAVALFSEVAETQQKRPETLHGLTVAAENDCSRYDRSHYSYSSRALEKTIQDESGQVSNGWYAPYEAKILHSHQSDVEHIVAAKEAHVSGLCDPARRAERKAFANDLMNLTLASTSVNRGKSDKDAAEWLPEHGVCEYVKSVVFVKRAYNLTVDKAEGERLDAVIASCMAGEVFSPEEEDTKPTSSTPEPEEEGASKPTPGQTVEESGSREEVLRKYDSNGNGRVTCAEVRAKGGPIPVLRSKHPALYALMTDRDRDGQVCES